MKSTQPVMGSVLCLLLTIALTNAADAPGTQAEIGRLETLRQRNPEAYSNEVTHLRAQLRERMSELAAANPQAHRALRERMVERKRSRLQQEHQRDPERFKARMEQQLSEVKRRNPALYEHVSKRRHAWRRNRAKRMQQRQESDRGGLSRKEESARRRPGRSSSTNQLDGAERTRDALSPRANPRKHGGSAASTQDGDRRKTQ